KAPQGERLADAPESLSWSLRRESFVQTSDRSQRGFSLKLFLAEGSPSGLKILEKSNWSGVGIVCPRPRFGAVKNRDEFARAGVYVLIGRSDNSDVPIAYIGEADP